MEELITPSRIPRPRIQARAIYRKWRRQEVGATEATEFAELTDEESGVGGDARFVDIVSVHRAIGGRQGLFGSLTWYYLYWHCAAPQREQRGSIYVELDGITPALVVVILS
jgi:hypothetical protein